MENVFPAVTGVYDSLSKSDDSATNPYIPISNEMKSANKLAVETVATDPNANIDDVNQDRSGVHPGSHRAVQHVQPLSIPSHPYHCFERQGEAPCLSPFREL